MADNRISTATAPAIGAVVEITNDLERPDRTFFAAGERGVVAAIELGVDDSVTVTIRMTDGRTLATTLHTPFQIAN
jgi:hypothetical protein